jgi:hypothetical protein
MAKVQQEFTDSRLFLYRILAALALTVSLAAAAFSQHSYPELKFLPDVNTRLWTITPDYPNPNPPPLRVKLNESTILEYTILSGYQTNFRSGPKIVDIIAKQVDEKNNNLNLSWLVHDINYDGYIKDRKVADLLLYSMLLDAGLPPPRAAAVYYGVRLLGKGHHCRDPKPQHPCAQDPRIRFQERKINTYKGSLQAIKELPTLDLQTMRLTLMTAKDKDEIRTEIRDLFPDNADAIIKELDAEGP